MPDFRTILPPVQSELKISHYDRTICTGSCFAENIGERLSRLKFPVLVNPFGIVYNPVSISQVLEKLITVELFHAEDLFENLGLWHSFSHHGYFSHPDKRTALKNINLSLQESRAFLEKTNRIIVTLGTANVFVLKKTGEIAANCHKVPGNEFERKRLSIKEVVNALGHTFEKLREESPLQIILTVSPVRHLRDGLTENQRSKATLLLAVEELCRCLPFVHYFPAYEIVLDDLRDYRFYEEDMTHPNQTAIDYIWKYFEAAFFDEKTNQLCRQIAQLVTASKHRPIHPESTEHQAFLKKQLNEIRKLEEAFPALDFSREREVFSQA